MTPGMALDEHIRKVRAYFDGSRRALAKAYRPYRYSSLITSLLFDFTFLWLIVFSRAGRVLEGIPLSYLLPIPCAAVWAALVLTLRSVLSAPLSYVTGYLWPKKFGLVVHSRAQHFKDDLLSLAVALPVVAGGAAVLEWLIVMGLDLWWLYASLLASAASVVITMLLPVLLMPLFNKFVPMQDGSLKQALLDMARQAGVSVAGIYVMDMSRRTTTANAMLTGLGPTRRMIVGDTLLTGFPEDEVQVVMAHELAHHYYRHITKGLALSALVLPPIFFLAFQLVAVPSALAAAAPGSMRYLGAFAAVLYLINLLSSPVSNRLSRFFEWQSDEFALKITGMADASARMFARLADGALSDIDPPAIVQFFFYSHPPALERVAHALRFKDAGPVVTAPGATRKCARPRETC